MGFGFLVFGYMMLFNVPFKGFDIPPDILGYILILVSLIKISKYGLRLKKTLYTLPALMLLSLAKLGLQFADFSGKENLFGFALGDMSAYCAIAEMILQLPFYFFLCKGIRDLAEQVKLPKVVSKAGTALFSVYFFDIFTIFANMYIRGVIPPAEGVTAVAIYALQQLAGYVVRWIVLILFISCYMNITLEGYDENRKPGLLERVLMSKKKREDDK